MHQSMITNLFLILSQFSGKMSKLRNRLMVGHIPLEDGILVRVQVPQQKHG